MKISRTIGILFLFLVAAMAGAQGWSDAYLKALNAAKAENWAEARDFFKKALSMRQEDVSGPTNLDRNVTDPKLWRKGASYSPNFGAAYAGYKLSLKIANDNDRNSLLKTVAGEFQAIVNKSQLSQETYFFLNNIYGLMRDDESNKKLERTYAGAKAAQKAWLVDREIITGEDYAAIFGLASQPAKPVDEKPQPEEPTLIPEKKADPKPEPKKDPEPKEKPAPKEPKVPEEPVTVKQPEEKKPEPPKNKKRNPVADDDPVRTSRPAAEKKAKAKVEGKGSTTINAGDEIELNPNPVEPLATKYALIVGNSDSKIAGAAPEFAANDADFLAENVIKFGGYPATNVIVLKNVTAGAIAEAANKLAESMPENATVLVYFTGAAFHLDGKDYLAGVDTPMASDTSTMLEKTSLFAPFMRKGARIFSFFQVSRPLIQGQYFGQEVLQLGSISQMQGTIPGGEVRSKMKGGKMIGLFTEAMTLVMNDFHSNKIPVMEFGWQVFDRIKRGDTGTLSGGATQVPTLPILTNMAPDARF